ncbi:MAG TPA: mycofactocin system glycosyltransferase, partial [Geobacteraceae bacterium]|nr:mycofactocin system glycosyltransferase [Geobacteraceae bacterium]
HLVRYYATPLIILALLIPQLLVLLFAVFGCAAGVDHAVRKPQLSLARFAGIYLLEQVAYGTGVFWGCLRGRTFASYRVVILRQTGLSA